MKCCKNKNDNKPFKFLGMMGLCCLAPIIISLFIPILGLTGAAAGIVPILSSLICPIMMGGMFFMLLKPAKDSSDKTN